MGIAIHYSAIADSEGCVRALVDALKRHCVRNGYKFEEVKPNVDFHVFICNFLQFMEFISRCKDLPDELKEFKGLLKGEGKIGGIR